MISSSTTCSCFPFAKHGSILLWHSHLIPLDLPFVIQHPPIQLWVVVRLGPAVVLEIWIPLEPDFFRVCLVKRIGHLDRRPDGNDVVSVAMEDPGSAINKVQQQRQQQLA